jgi:hypothetical protein
MKNRLFSLMALATLCAFVGCSDDDDKDSGMKHVGEQWKITQIEYTFVDMTKTIPDVSIDEAQNAGFFYFDAGKGSFDITVEGTRKEDVFTYTEDASSVNISAISQSAGGGTVSQNIIEISGEKTTPTTMTLTGMVVKQQSTSGQFSLTADFTLVKQ